MAERYKNTPPYGSRKGQRDSQGKTFQNLFSHEHLSHALSAALADLGAGCHPAGTVQPWPKRMLTSSVERQAEATRPSAGALQAKAIKHKGAKPSLIQHPHEHWGLRFDIPVNKIPK